MVHDNTYCIHLNFFFFFVYEQAASVSNLCEIYRYLLESTCKWILITFLLLFSQRMSVRMYFISYSKYIHSLFYVIILHSILKCSVHPLTLCKISISADSTMVTFSLF